MESADVQDCRNLGPNFDDTLDSTSEVHVIPGNGIQFVGRTSKFLSFTAPRTLTSNSFIEFDVKVSKQCLRHGIGLLDDENAGLLGNTIIRTAGRELGWADPVHLRAVDGIWQHCRIPVGLVYPQKSYRSLAFVNDCDCRGSGCQSTVSYANVVINM